LKCFGLSFKYVTTYIKKEDIQEILEWLFEAAHLAEPPLNLNEPPKVSDAEYILFAL
jgi:hypothetical protein